MYLYIIPQIQLTRESKQFVGLTTPPPLSTIYRITIQAIESKIYLLTK